MAMTARRALLTGATGFVGGHVARALCDEGWSVRALVRSDPSRAPLLAGLPIEFVRGDLSAAAQLDEAARGCAAVVHVAGVVKARTLDDYREVNVRATERLAAAAARAAPESVFVLVSSQAAAGPARNGRPVTASDPARPVSWYGVSKLEGEEAVRRAFPGAAIVLRPGVVYGPGDTGLLTFFRMAARGLVAVPGGRRRIQIVEAERVARAIARAAGRADLGRRTAFLCDREPVAIRRLAGEIARLAPRPARLIGVPDPVVRLAGAAETVREAITRRSRPFNADKARELLAGEWLCEAGLERDLELPAAVPLEQGLRDTWDWYLRQGWLIL
jgi:nucleoside-diphosphate-sugar epimerase